MAATDLRVLHFRRLYSNLSEAFLHDSVTAMARCEGVRAQMLCLLRLNARRRPFPTTALLPVPPLQRLWLALGRMPGARRTWESDSLLWPALRVWLRAQLRREAPSIVHAHFGPDGHLIAPVASALGLPLAVSFYGYDVSRLVRRFGARWRPRYRLLFERADLLVAISGHVRRRLLELGAPAEKVRVLPLGVALERFPWRDPAAGFDGRQVRCLHVGRLTAKKSPVLLVRAFARARARLDGRVDLRLALAGEGEERAPLEREIRALGVGAHVELLGAVPHARVPELLAGAHLYTQHCVTGPDGDEEGLGVTFLEAAACGLPVVATDHAGIADVVRHGVTGLLSPEGDAEAMAEHIAQLALDPARWTALGRNGRALVESSFALGDAAQRTVEALRAAAGAPAAPKRALA